MKILRKIFNRRLIETDIVPLGIRSTCSVGVTAIKTKKFIRGAYID